MAEIIRYAASSSNRLAPWQEPHAACKRLTIFSCTATTGFFDSWLCTYTYLFVCKWMHIYCILLNVVGSVVRWGLFGWMFRLCPCCQRHRICLIVKEGNAQLAVYCWQTVTIANTNLHVSVDLCVNTSTL